MPGRHAKPRPTGRRIATATGVTALFGGGMSVGADHAGAAQPTSIAIDPSANVVLGSGDVYATTTVVRTAPTATGQVVFQLFGPNNAACTGAPAFTTAPVALPAGSPAATVSTPAFAPPAAGTYRWVVAYSDTDMGHAADAATTPCNDADSVVVAKATPTVTATPSPGVALGAGTIADTADVVGGVGPTGTITFRAFTDDTCAGAPAFPALTMPYAGVPLTLDPARIPTSAAAYRWVASYSGDANNAPAASACGATNQTVVSRTAPTITTTAGADLRKGLLTDTAVVAGRINPQPGATVTFSAYGPGNDTCTGTAAYSRTVAMPTGTNTVSAPGFRPTATGTYRWIASYSGDANNGAVSGACTDTGETTSVSTAPASGGSGGGSGGSGGSGGATCFGYAATIVRGDGDDTINGTSGRDVIVAGGGNDIVYGNGGNDVICAGDGNDAVDGGSGADLIDGGDGNDTLYGNDGGDVILGGDDADEIHGGDGDDSLAGQGGDDLIDGGRDHDDCRGGDGEDAFTSCERTM